MADNKKYYYLKLKDNFFESDELVILQNMKDGYVYSDILMKLYLKSLKSEGRLMFKERIPYNPEILATLVRHPVAFVKEALDVFERLGLIERLDNGAIYMLDIQNFIGQSSTEADRMRLYRNQITNEKKQLSKQSVTNVITNVQQTCDISAPEIEIEKELELEKEIYSSAEPNGAPIPYKEIIDYLNQKASSKYKHTSKKTQTLIKARINEGFVLDDFKKVIDIKVNEWIKTDMSKFLRPETLFGTKFEGYLNQELKGVKKDEVVTRIDENGIKYDAFGCRIN